MPCPGNPRRALPAAALALALMGSAQGDDTEIYLGHGDGLRGANPNVLFIIDTSDSMATLVTVTRPYDPGEHYPAGSDGACNGDDLVFFSTGDDTPGCDERNHFRADILRCMEAGESLQASGRFLGGRYAAWLPRNRGRHEWRSGASRLRDARAVHVECAADAGVHGAAPGPLSHPANGVDGPWSDQPGAVRPNRWTAARLYSGNYIRWWNYQRETSTRSRLEIVQQVTRELVDSISGVNAGLMRFDTLSGNFNPSHGWARPCDPGSDPLCLYRCTISGSSQPCASVDAQGGAVIFPVSDLDSPGVREAFKATVDGLTLHGYTPLAETLYEAMRYYRGEPPHYGRAENGAPGHPQRASHADAVDGGRYVSPISSECARNHIVLLSDGLPNTDNDADHAINALLSAATDLGLGGCDNGRGQPVDNCLDELAEYLYRSDSAPELDGLQNIITYTVGFNLPEADILESAARYGGGRYHSANDARELSDAFTRIIENILRRSASFTAPAVTINAFNRLTHRNELYFAVFEPDYRPHWPGNVKKFRIDQANGGGGRLVIVDAHGRPAIDESTGFFRDGARSLWTFHDQAPDGGSAAAGGLAARLFDYADGQHDAASRGDSVFTLAGAAGGAPAQLLTDPSNRLHEDNAATADNPNGRITREMLGLAPDSTDAELVALLRWARGVDELDADGDGADDDGRPTLGAPLHTRPVLATWAVDQERGTQDERLFLLTNDGFLHMASTTDPSGSDTPGSGERMEHWAFIPPDKLANLNTLYHNHEADNILYGNDGGMTLWMADHNGDGRLLDTQGVPQAGEHAFLYFGQRRGGSHYHALDVTDPDQPRHLWSVSGEQDPSHPLAQLGQSWSSPRHTRLLFAGTGDRSLTPRDIILIGGGYDTRQDDYGARSADHLGNTVFILDAMNGEVLWWAGGTAQPGGASPDLLLPNMRYSIPADIRLIDLNGDGVTDRFYAADSGGQLWRFDVDNRVVDTLSRRISGGRIADLQTTSPADAAPGESSNRRFYYPPDVALIIPEDGSEPFHSVAIGSGYRAHPNDVTIRDRIHVIKDRAMRGPPTDDDGDIVYPTLHAGDLLDVTDLIDFESDAHQPLDDEQQRRLDNGWYIELEDEGEKVLAPALTVNGMVLVTSFIPAAADTPDSDACATPQGRSRLYALGAVDGRPMANLDGEGGVTPAELTRSDRFLELARPGIAPEPTILFPDAPQSSPMPIIGTELIPQLPLDNAPQSTYWYQHDVH